MFSFPPMTRENLYCILLEFPALQSRPSPDYIQSWSQSQPLQSATTTTYEVYPLQHNRSVTPLSEINDLSRDHECI